VSGQTEQLVACVTLPPTSSIGASDQRLRVSLDQMILDIENTVWRGPLIKYGVLYELEKGYLYKKKSRNRAMIYPRHVTSPRIGLDCGAMLCLAWQAKLSQRYVREARAVAFVPIES
jgi:hypothetical protein